RKEASRRGGRWARSATHELGRTAAAAGSRTTVEPTSPHERSWTSVGKARIASYEVHAHVRSIIASYDSKYSCDLDVIDSLIGGRRSCAPEVPARQSRPLTGGIHSDRQQEISAETPFPRRATPVGTAEAQPDPRLRAGGARGPCAADDLQCHAGQYG